MEFECYQQRVTHIVAQELTQQGWVDLIYIPIESPYEATPEEIQNGIEEVEKLFYKADKLHLSVQGIHLCIRGLDQGGRTFRVKAWPYTQNR
jgi:hypothetical protein